MEVQQTDIVARTVQGFCAAYGLSRATAYRLIAAGRLKTCKALNRTLVVEASARELLGLPAVLPMSETEISRDNARQRETRPYHKSRRPKAFEAARDNVRR